MDPVHKRKKRSDKAKRTFDLYGKNTPRGVRIKETENQRKQENKKS